MAGQFKSLGRALRHRNYRLFFFGQGVSLVGTWMQRTALSWLVYRLTGSMFLLGVVGFSSQIPGFFLPPFAGVLADRVDRRRLLIYTQILGMIQALALGILTLTGFITVWQIIALSVMLGLINAFDIPIRQSFVVEMLEDRNDLPNAIAMNSFIFNGAKMAGPALAGILVYRYSESICFLINAISFIAVIAALAAIRTKPAIVQSPTKPLQDLKDGLVYSFGSPAIRSILMLIAMTSLLGMAYLVLLPAFAKEILKGDSDTFGYMVSATSVGAMVGVFYLAARKSAKNLESVIPVASVIFGGALVVFAFSSNLHLSLALLTVAGFGAMIQMVVCNTILQTIVEDKMRGRVMSFYTVSFMGMVPVGNLLIGALADHIGAPWAVALGGMGCILAAGWFMISLPALKGALHLLTVRNGQSPSIAVEELK